MDYWYERTEMLLGAAAIKRLRNAHVAVFGIGGVGGFAVEALARAGVGRLTIVDNDVVTNSNRNRQIIATVKTVGRRKVEVMKERIADINPEAVVHAHHCFVLPGAVMAQFPFSSYSYLIDALDTVTAKVELVRQAGQYELPIISCMGTGNKLDPSRLEVADIYQTDVCPLAKVMRRELRAREIAELEVVYSREIPRKPLTPVAAEEMGEGKRATPGSVSFVPSAAGLLLAATVINRLTVL